MSGARLRMEAHSGRMRKGIGVDLVQIERFECLFPRERHLQERVFTTVELRSASACRNSFAYLAVRLAVKAAFFKALGTGLSGDLPWCDVEFLQQGKGKPVLWLRGKTAQAALHRGVRERHVSVCRSDELPVRSSGPRILPYCGVAMRPLSACPRPSAKPGTPTFPSWYKAARLVSGQLTRGQLVVLESTTYPGTTRELLLPVLEETGLKVGVAFTWAILRSESIPGTITIPWSIRRRWLPGSPRPAAS